MSGSGSGSTRELELELGKGRSLPVLLELPADARALYVLAHGAGAGMRHAFMEAISERLAEHGVGTLRYPFPFMEAGARRPDPQPRLLATVRRAVAFGVELGAGRPILAGGKSMGGRMTSLAAAESPLEGVAGLVLLGFPLHPAGKPGVERADHLSEVDAPLLFLQGTRDRLASLELLAPIVAKLARAELHVVEGADHGFHVGKRSGRTDDDVLSELASSTASFV